MKYYLKENKLLTMFVGYDKILSRGKFMKNIFVKIIIVFIAIFSIISFVGCKKDPNPNPNPDGGPQPTLGDNVND